MAKKDTTAQDIPVQTEVSDAEVAAFDIQPHLVNMLLTEPFFAEIMRNITKNSEQTKYEHQHQYNIHVRNEG